mmetsp:Transcript_42938/g.99454  ORF Transcript_42938/g.99454 Transcript_42938/m.99454 type:complete len:87 (+) Transcript_42938:113-373(+)
MMRLLPVQVKRCVASGLVPRTLLSLVSPAFLRRRDFTDEAEAWAAFHACAGSPCMLRDPRGADAASRCWLVVGGSLSSSISKGDVG